MSDDGRPSESSGPRRILGLPPLTGPILGDGFFHEVWAPSEDVVIKVARPLGPFRQPLSWLVRNRREHDLVAGIARIPETYHVRMRDEHGRLASVLLQRRLNGRLLSHVPDGEVLRGLGDADLRRTVDEMERCLRANGWLPDVIGGPPRWGMHDVRRSNNYLLDDGGELWLIDPGALFLWFSRRNPVGWLYTRVLVLSARRLARRARRAARR